MRRKKKKHRQQNDGRNRSVVQPQEPMSNPEIKCQEQNYQQTVNKPKSQLFKPWSTAQEWLVVLTAIIAFVYFLQLQSMRNAVDVTRKSTERQDRTWLSVKPVAPFNLTQGNELGIQFVVVNTGKTPARHIHVNMWSDFMPVESRPVLDETKAKLQAEVGDLFPNNINELAGFNVIQVRRQRNESHRSYSVPVQAEEATAFRDGKVYAINYIAITYTDIFGVDHWTRYCADIRPPYAHPNTDDCVTYNREDDNEEP